VGKGWGQGRQIGWGAEGDSTSWLQFCKSDSAVLVAGKSYSAPSLPHSFTNRPEMVVGWYHSHPGFGCWLSGVDINTQQSFEALNARAVAVVVDPVQSVKGKVVIDAFRLISPQTMMLGQEPRQTTSNLGALNKPSIQVRARARLGGPVLCDKPQTVGAWSDLADKSIWLAWLTVTPHQRTPHAPPPRR